MEEKEVKVKLSKIKFDELLARYSPAKTINQKDIYFDSEIFHFNNLNRGLRVRFDNSIAAKLEFKSLFYNKSKLNNPWFIEEIGMKFPLSHQDQTKLNEVFKRVGLAQISVQADGIDYTSLVKLLENEVSLTQKITVTKQRVEVQLADVIYTFDYIHELGYFLEIESKEKDPLDILKELLDESDYEFIRNGYNDMVGNTYANCLSNEVKQLLFKLNTSWNITDFEKDYVKKLLVQ